MYPYVCVSCLATRARTARYNEVRLLPCACARVTSESEREETVTTATKKNNIVLSATDGACARRRCGAGVFSSPPRRSSSGARHGFVIPRRAFPYHAILYIYVRRRQDAGERGNKLRASLSFPSSRRSLARESSRRGGVDKKALTKEKAREGEKKNFLSLSLEIGPSSAASPTSSFPPPTTSAAAVQRPANCQSRRYVPATSTDSKAFYTCFFILAYLFTFFPFFSLSIFHSRVVDDDVTTSQHTPRDVIVAPFYVQRLYVHDLREVGRAKRASFLSVRRAKRTTYATACFPARHREFSVRRRGHDVSVDNKRRRL